MSGKHGFDYSHCHKPTPVLISEDIIRVYFGTRDKQGKTRTTFVDLSSKDPKQILYVHDKPVIDLGKIGAFDDSGANVCSVVMSGRSLYMYYIGWNPSTTVHTRNAIGLAVSIDDGHTFKRLYDGAILDRSKEEPYYTGAVDVKIINGQWKMWYTSGTEWKMVNGRPEIWYHIKYAESKNGIDWVRDNVLCIPPIDANEATARPSVWQEHGMYKMLYSKRSIVDFRTNPKAQYGAGYADSRDGKAWIRHDEDLNLVTSKNGWDSEAIAYPYLLQLKDRKFIFYNGGGFGKTGFGYAVVE